MPQLRRITSGSSWIPQIDGLRFVAIMSVVLFHLSGEVHVRGLYPVAIPTAWPQALFNFTNGDRGVWCFFVISGFILARPFLRQYRLGGHPVQLGAYFLRRVTRLEPPYILMLLLSLFAAYLMFPISLKERLPHLLASIFYVHNLFLPHGVPINFVLWTLEIEVQFYILAPLMGNLYRIENTVLRRSIFALLVLASGFGSLFLSPYFHGTLLYYAQYFFAGFLLADLLEYPRYSNHESWSWDLVSVAGWPIVFFLPRLPATEAWLPLVLIPLYLAAFRGKLSNWFFRHPLIALTGGMCYSIYLTHVMSMSISYRLVKYVRVGGETTSPIVQLLLLLVPTLLGGLVYFVLIERPCMDPKWPLKLWCWVRGRESEITI